MNLFLVPPYLWILKKISLSWVTGKYFYNPAIDRMLVIMLGWYCNYPGITFIFPIMFFLVTPVLQCTVSHFLVVFIYIRSFLILNMLTVIWLSRITQLLGRYLPVFLLDICDVADFKPVSSLLPITPATNSCVPLLPAVLLVHFYNSIPSACTRNTNFWIYCQA